MKIKFLMMMSVMVLMAVASASAQRGYTEYATDEGVKVMYRWQRAQFFNRNSDAVLNLHVTNENETPVRWTHSVVFFNDKMAVHESEESTLCILPGQSKRGAFAGLRYSLEGMKLDVVESDFFEWELGIFEVEEVEDCKD